MTTQSASQERREVLATARRYRRDGYKVSGPDQWPSKPGFLGDIVPDLIAEREDDKVVIEIKNAAAVRGANDIVELAARVATQPGWRFELIALRSIDDGLKPDFAWGDQNVERLVEQGFLKPAYIVTCAMIENILAFAAVQRRLRPPTLSTADILKDFLVKGVIDETAYDAVHDARRIRNALMHDPDEPDPTRADIRALMKLGSALQQAISVDETSAEPVQA